MKSEAKTIDVMVNDEMLRCAKQLVNNLEHGDISGIQDQIDELARLRESDLFQELGKLTRQLHESLCNFDLDTKITTIAEQGIPDAKARLNHVIAMTEQAANKTMNALDEAMPLSGGMRTNSAEVHAEWKKFRSRALSVDDFIRMSKKLDAFFPEIEANSEKICARMSDIMLAQDFQDLTGQIIRKVINLVQEVESSLVEMVRLSGKKKPVSEVALVAVSTKGFGPEVPGVAHGETVKGQDEVDALLSSLGF